MYLSKKTYVKRWGHNPAEDKHVVSVKKGGRALKHIKPRRVTNVIEEVGYWRKANQIHSWFVNNVQGGTDNCEEHNVTIGQLQLLKSICLEGIQIYKNAIKTTSKKGVQEYVTYSNLDIVALKILLPSSSGFFFGSSEYDYWYLQGLKDTVTIIDEAILGVDIDKNWSVSFSYQSSW